MYRRKAAPTGKSPRTWGEAYRELAAIQARADELLAQWKPRMEEEIASSSCCIAIAAALTDFRQRAWRRAVREHERGATLGRRTPQLELFKG